MNEDIQMVDRCILTHEAAREMNEGAFILLPQAKCAGMPPGDPLLLYPLCVNCDLLHHQNDRSLFTKLSEYMAESRVTTVEQQESLKIGLAAVMRMLERLLRGDTDARVALPTDVGSFLELEPLLNRLGDFLTEQIDGSHEFAIGLCEHYETLLKLAKGDLECRASTSSPVELIAKLGELINLQVDAFIGVITTLHDKEQEMLSQSRLQKGIIDFLPDATFVIDSEHRVIAWNQAMTVLSGVPESEILGKGDYAYSIAFYGEKRPLLIDLIDVDLDVALGYYRTVERHGSTLIAEGGVPLTRYGSARDLWITASPLFDLDGRAIGAIESVRDITAFKEAEAEREMLKDQLHHAQKLDSIGQLAGGIAHEFNNILAAILGYAGILEMRLGADSPNLSAVQRIITASEKAASLTRGMLAFSRKHVVALEPVPLNSFLLGMKEMLCRLAGENIRIRFELDPRELSVHADLGQLQQMVLNLYNNARDAMPDGGELVFITTARTINGSEVDIPGEIAAGNYVQLTVADTGCGIAPENLDMIFDPFFTTKEVGKGTGLGLSIVFGIMKQHEGFIRVSSEMGKGTTFSVWFPEFSAGIGECADGGRTVLQQEERACATVLVGEDNEDVRPMIVELLQDVGYQVFEARDGVEVVALMEDFGDTVDLLLLDVIMPRMNGYEALSAVRVRFPHIPCVFLSGYSDDILKQKAKISGEFEYLSKPIMPDKLIAAVRAAIEAAKAARPC